MNLRRQRVDAAIGDRAIHLVDSWKRERGRQDGGVAADEIAHRLAQVLPILAGPPDQLRNLEQATPEIDALGLDRKKLHRRADLIRVEMDRQPLVAGARLGKYEGDVHASCHLAEGAILDEMTIDDVVFDQDRDTSPACDRRYAGRSRLHLDCFSAHIRSTRESATSREIVR